jgi:hypothetical protein
MMRRDERRDSDPPAPRHSSLPTLKGVHPSRCEAALKPVDPRGLSMELREPPGTVRDQPMHLREEWARLRGEPKQRQERPTGSRMAATGPRPEETRLERGTSAAPSPPWIAARCFY